VTTAEVGRPEPISTSGRLPFAAGSFLISAVLTAIGSFSGDDDHAWRQWLIVLAISAVVTAVVFWVIRPADQRPAPRRAHPRNHRRDHHRRLLAWHPGGLRRRCRTTRPRGAQTWCVLCRSFRCSCHRGPDDRRRNRGSARGLGREPGFRPSFLWRYGPSSLGCSGGGRSHF